MVLIEKNPDIIPFGSPVPEVSVTTLEGEKLYLPSALAKGSRGLVVVFTCNHCPYAKAYDLRTVSLARKTLPRGIHWIAVNPNAANKNYAEDSLEKMQEKASALDLPYPYTADLDQSAARAFGAACTPEYFLFSPDQGLVYTGRLDDEMEEEKVHHRYLEDAIEDLLSGRTIRQPRSHPLGCSIKWL